MKRIPDGLLALSARWTLAAALTLTACQGVIDDPANPWATPPGPDASATTDATTTDSTPSDTAPSPDAAPPDTNDINDINDSNGADAATPDTVVQPEVLPTGCLTDHDFFQTQIWAPIMQSDCAACHNPQGMAGQSAMVFAPDMTTAQRFEAVRAVAEDTSTGGVPRLLLKPTLQVPHGGAQRFQIGDDTYLAFVELVHRYGNPDSCNDIVEPPVLCSDDGTIRPGPTPFRRLSSDQLANTLDDLFWPGIAVGAFIPVTEPGHSYRTWPGGNPSSQTVVDALWYMAEAVADDAVSTPSALIACAPDTGDIDAACVDTFIASFGRRAFRRPLTAAEQQTFQDLAAAAPDSASATVMRMLIMAMLQSPQFLYHDATGAAAVAGQPDIDALDQYAIASRLSYLVWNTMPDQELFDLADAGMLADEPTLAAQVDRLLADDRGRRGVLAFHQDFLQLGKFDGNKSAQAYPGYDTTIGDMMLEEVDRFVEHVVFGDGGGRHADLMTLTESPITPELAEIYGVSSVGSDWELTDLGPQRPGLLTRAAHLANFATGTESQPIQRGVMLVERMFCQHLVPPEVPPLPEDPPDTAPTTLKDKLAQHKSDPSCFGCHTLIDPLGMAFEHFDAIGGWRDDYATGLPVDATGALANPAGSFDGAAELVDLLVNSDIVRNCYAEQWFTYVVGRSVDSADLCGLTTVKETFAQDDGDIRALIVELVLSDAFRYRVNIDADQN